MTQNVSTSLKRDSRLLSYCYVRFKGGLLRITTVKLFYTDSTKLVTFITVAHKFGDRIKEIDFPESPEPVSQEEHQTAAKEGRIVF